MGGSSAAAGAMVLVILSFLYPLHKGAVGRAAPFQARGNAASLECKPDVEGFFEGLVAHRPDIPNPDDVG